MSLKQTVYFMTLVGAIAGLTCWALQVWIGDLYIGSQLQQNIIVTCLMGALIGGMTVGFADAWDSERVVLHWVVFGGALSGVAGAVSGGLFYLPALDSLTRADGAGPGPWVGRILTWLIAGGSIGFATGLRWFGINRWRSVHAMIGGLVGGGIGGVLFTFFGSADEIFQALAFVLTGMGITCGAMLAPVLLRDGVLQFLDSADPHAQTKYGSPQQEWVLQQGDRLVVGSLGTDRTMTMYKRPVDIYIPDAMMARRHAELYGEATSFFIQRHPDNSGLDGRPHTTLQVNGDDVTRPRELRSGDEILLGQTRLRFCSKRQQPTRAQSGERR